jgi:hypothetical protein
VWLQTDDAISQGWERDTVSRAHVDECGGEIQALRKKRPNLESINFTPRVDDELKEKYGTHTRTHRLADQALSS